MAEFIKSIDYVIKNEGGFVDGHAIGDPGGATNFGITEHMLSFKRGVYCTPDDVKNLKLDEAEVVYFVCFWMPLKLTEVFNQAIGTAIFDIAVNIGMSRAVRFSQIACCIAGYPISADSKMGPETRDVLSKIPAKDFIPHFAQQVSIYYMDLVAKNPHLQKFLHGWLNRAERLKTLI
jgi:lysozyme family protein